MTYKTKHDRLILKAVETKETQVGRIVLPDLDYQKSSLFEVVATGPGFVSPLTGQFITTQYQVGDRVFCNKAVMNSLGEVDGVEYFATRDNEPLGYVIDENED
jgi:co-chaperonin GroES (HSP10)